MHKTLLSAVACIFTCQMIRPTLSNAIDLVRPILLNICDGPTKNRKGSLRRKILQCNNGAGSGGGPGGAPALKKKFPPPAPFHFFFPPQTFTWHFFFINCSQLHFSSPPPRYY